MPIKCGGGHNNLLSPIVHGRGRGATGRAGLTPAARRRAAAPRWRRAAVQGEQETAGRDGPLSRHRQHRRPRRPLTVKFTAVWTILRPLTRAVERRTTAISVILELGFISVARLDTAAARRGRGGRIAGGGSGPRA